MRWHKVKQLGNMESDRTEQLADDMLLLTIFHIFSDVGFSSNPLRVFVSLTYAVLHMKELSLVLR